MSFGDEADVEVHPPVAVGMRGEQVWISLENEGDPRYDSHKEFWEPCREEWAETQSFIFKDSCSQGVGVKSMQGLYLVSSLLFVHAEKTALCLLLQASAAAEIMFGGTEHGG